MLWSDCREDLLLNFPLSVNLVSRDGHALSHSIQARKDLLTQFFEVSVVFRKEDLAATLQELGVRPSYDADVLRILQDLESIPKDRRVYLGMHTFGLSLQHFAMMNKDEVRSLVEAVLKPFAVSHQVLLSSLSRHLEKRVKELNETLPHGSASFGILLLQLLNGRMVSRMSKTYAPNFLRKPDHLDDDEMTLSNCAERYLTKLWDDIGLAKEGYDPARDALGSDPHYRAKLAEHAVLGYLSRDHFEAQLQRDFQLNEQAIGNVDAELLALVPDRVMFLADTRLPFDNPELLKLTVENFEKIEWTEPAIKDSQVSGVEAASESSQTGSNRGDLVAGGISKWSPLPRLPPHPRHTRAELHLGPAIRKSRRSHAIEAPVCCRRPGHCACGRASGSDRNCEIALAAPRSRL
jgi:hypothetical protein